MAVSRSALAVLALLLSSVPGLPCLAQDDSFAAGVRTTPWLKPEDEQKAFQLPPGFEIQLVAAEPDIQKPLNMAFDERGRIWLSCTVEYPYAAPLDKPGRDSIRVLEDTDGDGRFEKVHTFADGLNIPIGIYPYKGGCIAWSIPNIWHFEDTDGDGVCDKRTVLYGPFDHTRDTHGMCNAFRRGWDGWIYACHGFNNDSRVKGKDGHEVHMQSGNTFRFKLDGSRIEHFTHGQVNPFGMCFDELFNIFTADCHSKPLTQLIRGGYYPSFGKPHDGLGFVPPMMDHLHGSTAICGLVKYTGENFPAEYRGDFLSGNVMTSRINRNKPEYHGSTIRAIEQPDFLSTTDPWFRPVDLQIGPDGALYIADFYNRIIGHYEVPLPHPGRDRTSGRIWRVRYTGNQQSEVGGRKPEDSTVGNAVPGVPSETRADLTKLSIAELTAQLDSPQLEHRLRVLNYLADVKGEDCLAEAKQAFESPCNPAQLLGTMWTLERLGSLTQEQRVRMISNADRAVRVHALKLSAERLAWQPADQIVGTAAIHDTDAFVSRAAAEAFTRHDIENLEPLFDAWDKTLPDDGHRAYALRRAVRNNFNPGLVARETRYRKLAEIAVTIKTDDAARWLYHYLTQFDESDGTVVRYVEHVARYAQHRPDENLVAWARKRSSGNEELEVSLIVVLSKFGNQLVRQETSPWAHMVVEQLLKADSDSLGWTAVPLEGQPASESPWVVAPRPCGDGVNDQPFFYSLPKGEQRTGIYRSAAFEIPEKLSFWCAGHSGFPGQPLNDGNYVRLRDAMTHAVLSESRPPRNDVARGFEWDLKDHAGKQGYVELVDGDTANAYAWLAVGRFSQGALNPSDTARKQQLAAEIVGKLKLASLRPQLATLVASSSTDGAARAAIGLALVSLDPDSRASALVAALNEPSIPTDLRVAIGHTLTRRASEGVAEEVSKSYLDNLREVMKRAPSRLQTLVAETLAGDAAGADALLNLVEAGHASPRMLTAANVTSKFATFKNEKLSERVAAATARLPAASETLDRLILERRVAFARATPNLERGQAVYAKHCAACHQIAGKGSVVGPQLDGIGGRGLERIIEDVLDPNRNVDVAFRTTTIRLADGRVVSGLFRRAEGTQRVFADNQGKEFTLAKDEIDQETKTALSLMPANVPELVPAEEFYDLVGYLMSQRAQK